MTRIDAKPILPSSLDQILDGEINEFVDALVHDDQARKLEEIGS